MRREQEHILSEVKTHDLQEQGADEDFASQDASTENLPDALGLYLQEIPDELLNHQQEITFALSYRQSREKLIELEGIEDEEERQRIANLPENQQILQKGAAGREKLISHNLRLVISEAKKKATAKLPLIDLIQEGNIGLMKAVDNYNPDLGWRFSTYATWWIRQTVGRSIADKSREIRLPVHEHGVVNKIRKAEAQLSLELGREPTLEETAEIMDMPLEQIAKRAISPTHQHPVSIHKIVNTENNGTLEHIIPDPIDPTATVIDHLDSQRIIDIVGEKLDDRQRDIFMRRIVAHPADRETLEEVAQSYGLSRERIRQIERIIFRIAADVLTEEGYSL